MFSTEFNWCRTHFVMTVLSAVIKIFGGWPSLYAPAELCTDFRLVVWSFPGLGSERACRAKTALIQVHWVVAVVCVDPLVCGSEICVPVVRDRYEGPPNLRAWPVFKTLQKTDMGTPLRVN